MDPELEVLKPVLNRPRDDLQDRLDKGKMYNIGDQGKFTNTIAKEPQILCPPLLPPNSGTNLITPDGGVIKLTLTTGHGEIPPLFSRCLVHYVGRLQVNNQVFIDTRAESQAQQTTTVVAGRHTTTKETGISLAVASMRVGERAVVYIQDPSYGFGEAGNFSFPAVPPRARLTYEVELFGFEESQAGTEEGVSGLLYEERLERAEQRRLEGNRLVSQARHQEALSKYAVALSYLDEEFMFQLEGFHEVKANEIKLPIHLNMALCQLKMGDHKTAVFNCSEVLKIDAHNVKAFFRRGTANHAMGQTELALKDLSEASKMCPHDAAIRAELSALSNTMREERRAQAALFKGRLGPAPTASAHSASAHGDCKGAASNTIDSKAEAGSKNGDNPRGDVLGGGSAAVWLSPRGWASAIWAWIVLLMGKIGSALRLQIATP